MALPHFLCIGAQKAGTTWLFAQLQTHPGVWMPPVKELQFFSHLYVPQHRAWTSWHIRHSVTLALSHHLKVAAPPDLAYVRYLAELGSRDVFTDAWYSRAFDRPAAANRLLGDITPEYSTIPEIGVRHVRSLLGPVKVIYMIRAPLDRTLSQLRMNVTRKLKEPTEAQWMEMAEQWDLLNRGDYASYVPRWQAQFVPEDILFLPYGRISSDPEGLMRDVERFLDLPAHTYPNIRQRVHEGVKVAVPDAAIRRVEKLIEGQSDFLASEFGADFARLT